LVLKFHQELREKLCKLQEGQEELKSESKELQRKLRKGLKSEAAARRKEIGALQDKLTMRSIAISSINEDEYENVLKFLQIRMEAAKWECMPAVTEDADNQGFDWLSSIESSEGNRKAYMDHMKKLPWPEGYNVMDVAYNKMLSCKFANLSFKGSIDVVLATTWNVKEKTVKGNILLGVELKKPLKSEKPESAYWNQVVVQHICASFCNPDTGMLTLLTDLNEYWSFFWFGTTNSIFKISASKALAMFLLNNMFNANVEGQCPTGFHSRLSWNEIFPSHQRNATERNVVGRNADQDDDENYSTSAKSRKGPPKNDDGGAKEGNSDTSEDKYVGSIRALNVGRKVMYRDKWNDGRNVGNAMDLLDFVDEEEKEAITFLSIIQSNFPSLLTSIVSEDGDNDGKLFMTETNLMCHDAMLNG
jgi:hypothetical protein